MPITTSQSPVAPLINFEGLLCTFMSYSVTCPSPLIRARSRPQTTTGQPASRLSAWHRLSSVQRIKTRDGNADDQPPCEPETCRRLRVRFKFPCDCPRPGAELADA